MTKECPDKIFIPAPPETSEQIGCSCNECEFMKLNTMQKLFNTLKYEWPEILVDENVAKQAILPIEKMLDISKKMK